MEGKDVSVQTLEQKLESGELTVEQIEGMTPEQLESAAPVEPRQEDEPKVEAKVVTPDPGDTGQQGGEPAPETPPAAEPKPDGVQARDGKNVIPYAVLEGERERRGKAEAQVTELTARLAEAEKAQGGKPADPEAPGDKPSTSERIAKLKDEGYPPELIEQLEEQQRTIDELRGSVEQASKTVQTRDEREKAAAQKAVQDIIDLNPDLSTWQATNEALFDDAIDMDAKLKRDPAWQNKPISERFARAAELVRNLHGLEPAKPATPSKTPEVKRPVARAADTPRSLSDIPGGTPPAQSERENLANISPAQLEEKFSGMSDEEMAHYLGANL